MVAVARAHFTFSVRVLTFTNKNICNFRVSIQNYEMQSASSL